MKDLDTLAAEFGQAVNTYQETAPPLEAAAETAALFLLAGHALAVAPDATHMFMESSDQGNYMCVPSFLLIGDDHVAEKEWDALTMGGEAEDDLQQAASWLTWGHESWEQYADRTHRGSNLRGGYYALDLRRIKEAMA
jgi:hypothetical protein